MPAAKTAIQSGSAALRAAYNDLLRRRRLRLMPHALEPNIETFLTEMFGTGESRDRSLTRATLRELARRQKAASGGTHQLIIDDLARGMRREARRAVAPGRLMPTLAAEFPTGLINAQSKPVRGGALILINSGLMLFIHEITKLMLLELDIPGEPPGPTVDVHAVARRTVDAYLNYRDPTEAPRLPALSVLTVRGTIASRMTLSTEAFVLAHEFGHVAAGHISMAKTRAAETAVGEVELASKDWDEEFRADELGSQFLWAHPVLGYDAKDLSPRMAAAAAPLYFFALTGLVMGAGNGAQAAQATSDHPLPSARADRVARLARERFTRDDLEWAALFPTWVHRLTVEIAQPHD